MKRAFIVIVSLLSAIVASADKDVKFYMSCGEIKCVAQECVDSISFDEAADIVLVTLIDSRTETLSLHDALPILNVNGTIHKIMNR